MIGMNGIAKEKKWCCVYKRMTDLDKTRARRQVLVDEGGRNGFGTKECPVCHALCFDDMQTCYGCLHNFAADDGCFDRKKERLSESDIGSENNIGPKGGTTEDPRSFKAPVLPQEIEGQLEKNSPFSRAIACCENSLEAAGAPSAEEVRFSFKSPNGSQSDRELLEVVISVRSAQRDGIYESLQ